MKCAALCHISLHSSNLDLSDSVGRSKRFCLVEYLADISYAVLGSDTFPPRIELFKRAHVGQNVSLVLLIEALWNKTSIANACF